MLKLISIHIPKTAGRSFYQILKWAYGDSIGQPHNRGKHVINERFDESLINFDTTEVIHGHYYYRHIAHIHAENNPKVIVWLRSPVDRVISNYYYNINMNLQKPWKKYAKERKELTLLEFANRPGRQNTMSNFLSGIDPSELFFVGITERFDSDVKRLGQMLGWETPIPEIFENKGTDYYSNIDVPTKFEDISGDMRSVIKDLNAKDVELYEKML